jgi:hypothetical protein
MRRITKTSHYSDLIVEHKYTENLLNAQALIESLVRYYELCLIEIETEIERYSALLSEPD